MMTVDQIIKETERHIKASSKEFNAEQKRLRIKGFTSVALQQSRGWHTLSLDVIKARAYDRIVKSHNSRETPP